jgi:Fe2+ or Zn2+ uptake regulation protein
MPPGLRLTRQRKAVLTVIQQTEKHLSAQDIYDRVREQLPQIAYGTVYNALAYLKEAGLIKEIYIDGGPALYDHRTDRHDHLWCHECGRVLDYTLPDMEKLIQGVADQSDFKVDKAYVVFEGVCPNCQ